MLTFDSGFLIFINFLMFSILLPFTSWIALIILVVLTFFGSKIALFIYIILSLIVVWYTYIVNIWSKRKLKMLDIPQEDFQYIEKYAVFLIFPFASKILSIILNSVRWTWILMIVAIFMLDWVAPYFAIIPGLIFFLCSNISVNLDPIFFLSNAIHNWRSEFILELEMIKEFLAKINWIQN